MNVPTSPLVPAPTASCKVTSPVPELIIKSLSSSALLPIVPLKSTVPLAVVTVTSASRTVLPLTSTFPAAVVMLLWRVIVVPVKVTFPMSLSVPPISFERVTSPVPASRVTVVVVPSSVPKILGAIVISPSPLSPV